MWTEDVIIMSFSFLKNFTNTYSACNDSPNPWFSSDLDFCLFVCSFVFWGC